MTQNNYNQPDGRDGFAYLLEIFSPMMKAEDESALRLLSANSYSSDFITLMNVLNGNVFTPCIYKKL